MKKLVVSILLCLIWASPSIAWVDASAFQKFDERGMNAGAWLTYNNGEIEWQYRTNFDFTPSATLTIGLPYRLWSSRYGSILEFVPELGWITSYSNEQWSQGATIEAMVTFDKMFSNNQGLKTFSMWQYVHSVDIIESFIYQWAKVMWKIGDSQLGFQEQVFSEITGENSTKWFVDIGPSLQQSFDQFTVNLWYTWPIAEEDDRKLYLTFSFTVD